MDIRHLSNPPGRTLQPAGHNRPDATAGNAVARFNSVVLPHLGDAYALARWLTGSRTDAEDVVQDACIRAYRGIGKYRDGHARAWVLAIVRHAAYDWVARKRQAGGFLVEGPEALTHQLPDLETPETALLGKAGATQLEAAIAALPAPLRETLVLRDIHGLGYREIAKVTAAPIGTVMSRLARARKSLILTLTPAPVSSFGCE